MLGAPEIADQNIARLDVPVHEPNAVDRIKGVGQLGDEPHGALGR
jgi:hypothetical protein